MNYGSEKVTVSYRQERVIVGLCNVRKVFLDAWVVTIGRLGRGVGGRAAIHRYTKVLFLSLIHI